MGISAINGQGVDGMWKAGLVGAASGVWASTGGLGMVKAFGSQRKAAQLFGRFGYKL